MVFDEIFEEMNKSEIVYIDIDDIEPHPDNPRKNIGDISELAESIKVNGILQNLTVVPGETKPYRALIGHKRLAAAKQAGLLEVPCIVTEMDYKAQIAVMLQENMLRTDLTVYEQAQAFGQLQFDLGASISDISNMTGMSQTTVRRRMNLLDLNADEFKASQERGATMSDYLELEKIKDINLRNDVLKKAGTKDFGWALQSAVRKEADELRRAEWTELLDSVAEKVDIGTRSNREYLGYFRVLDSISQADRNKIDEAVTKAKECGEKLYWCQDLYNGVYLLGKLKTEHGATAEEQEAEEHKRKAKIAEIEAVEKNAYNLRKNFVLNYSGKKEHLTAIFKELLKCMTTYGCLSTSSIAKYLDIQLCDEKTGLMRSIFELPEFNTLLATKPQKVLLVCLFVKIDSSYSNFHDLEGNHYQNEPLERFYNVLEACGYEISSDEAQLIDGTHAVFAGDKNDSQAK